MANNLTFREFYKRRLPHIQIRSATYFITFRLANSLSVDVIKKLAEESNHVRNLAEDEKESAYYSWFEKFDRYLDQAIYSKNHLSNNKIARVIAEAIEYRDGKVYDLIAYCIMPNHVHLVCKPLEKSNKTYFSLAEILHSLKRHTPREANKMLQRQGAFWQDESYDYFIRDEAELERIFKYVLYNPVKANLVEDQVDWTWSYSKYEM